MAKTGKEIVATWQKQLETSTLELANLRAESFQRQNQLRLVEAQLSPIR